MAQNLPVREEKISFVVDGGNCDRGHSDRPAANAVARHRNISSHEKLYLEL